MWLKLAAPLPALLALGCGRTPCDACREVPCFAARCTPPCAATGISNEGCTFVATVHARIRDDDPDAVAVVNRAGRGPAELTTFDAALGERSLRPREPQQLAPGESTVVYLGTDPVRSDGSDLRRGGVVQLESNVPIAAFQHSPWRATQGNAASLLLPVETLGTSYVAFSYPPRSSLEPLGGPSYFDVIPIHDGTRIDWTPLLTGTARHGSSVPEALAGERASVLLNRFEVLRVAATAPDSGDVSGTVINSTHAVAVISGTRCADIPSDTGAPAFAGCDPLQQQLFPIELWGEHYVAAPAPVRGNERHRWRIFAGAPSVTITIDPPQPGTPTTLDAVGDFVEFEVPNGEGFELHATDKVMPLQYLQSAYLPRFDLSSGTAKGDASMLQTVPVDRFLSRYVVTSPDGFDDNYAQVVRGSNDIIEVDGSPIADWRPLFGPFELAEVRLDPGVHEFDSGTAFGLALFGYTDPENRSCRGEPNPVSCFSSYAYPAGIRVAAE